MKICDLYEDGRIVKGVNTTSDVDTNSISKETAKFGSKVDKDGRPPILYSKAAKNSTPNKLANLGLAENRFTPMELAVMEGGHSLKDYRLLESDLLIQQYSTATLLKFLKKLSDLPVDMLLKKAIYKELKKRKAKIESLQEIKAVTNIDKGEEIYIPASDFKKAAYETKIKGYEIYRAKSKLGPMPLEHFLVKDPNSDGFLGELKLTGFHKYYTSDVFFDPKIQGKGLALPLYAYVVKKGYDLVSDREQSRGSQAIWKNLTKVPGIFVYAWDRKHNEFFQWDPDEELDSAIYYNQDKLDQLEKDYKDGNISNQEYKKAKDELSADLRFNDVRLVAIDEKKNIKENFADGEKTNEAFVNPQFDVEWDEAARYPEFQKIGKEAWIELAKKGTAITIKSAKGIENTDAADPDSFKSLDPNKQKRALAQLEKGEVEMPIVAVYSDGYKELVAGNTRLTAMMARDGKATVWAFKVPDEIATLAEGPQDFADMNLDGNKLQQSLDYFYKDHAPNKIGGRKEEGLFKGYKVVTFTKSPDTLMFLVDKNDQAVFYVAYSSVEDGVAIGNVRSNGSVRATEVYAHLVSKFGTLYSDDKQTPQGRKIWSDLAKFFSDIDVKDTGDRLVATLAENFADGKKKGKSRPGRVKRAGASCNGSVTSLRRKAKKYSGERGKMYHWCANMKSGRK